MQAIWGARLSIDGGYLAILFAVTLLAYNLFHITFYLILPIYPFFFHLSQYPIVTPPLLLL